MPNFVKLKSGIDVSGIAKEIEAAPELWNQFPYRTQHPSSPHHQADDIYVRFNAYENYKNDITKFNDPHLPSWYPAAEKLPSVKKLALWLMNYVEGEILGGILITRIPPWKQVKPHIDSGFHAEFYDKFLINIEAHKGQHFIFENDVLESVTGDLTCFRNDIMHSVVNPTDKQRISLIICIKTGKKLI